MSFGDQQLLGVLNEISASSQRKERLRAVVAFDGFVDEIKRVIKHLDPQGMPVYYASKSEFLNSIQNDWHNKDLQLETVCRKIGGSGVLVSSALAEMGTDVEAWVAIGQEPDFDHLRQKAVLHDIGQPPLTWALEFDTGKVMMADRSSLDRLDWEVFKKRTDLEEFSRRIEESDVLILTGYAILQHGHALYQAICTEILPKLKRRPKVFLDLADISSKSRKQLEQLAKLLRQFGRIADTEVLLNRNECEALLSSEEQRLSTRYLAEQAQKYIAPCGVAVHTATESAVCIGGQTTVVLHPKLSHVTVRTGCGDHFCAGYCMGSAMNLPKTRCLQLGAAVAQCYMAQGSSSTRETLAAFLEQREQPMTPPYRMVAMDFDGTILNSAHRISEHTAQMLKRAEEAGVSLCVNTGRSFNDAMHLIQNCNCFDYIITSNGCDLRDLKKNVTIDCKTLSQETVEQVIALLKQYRVYFECFIQGQAVTEKNLIEILKADADVYADYLQGGGDCVQSVDNFKDYITQETLAVSKLYVMAGSPQQAAEIRSALQSVQGLSCTSSGAQNIEVIPPFVDKADAVEEMARYVGISLSEVISIGDGENDMEMIRRCGCGIAMENGLQELQACADYICPSVSNEGAADAIEYFLGL